MSSRTGSAAHNFVSNRLRPYDLAKIIAKITRNKEMKLVVDITSFYQKVGEGGDPTEANRILGTPTITFNEWLKQRKAKLDSP